MANNSVFATIGGSQSHRTSVPQIDSERPSPSLLPTPTQQNRGEQYECGLCDGAATYTTCDQDQLRAHVSHVHYNYRPYECCLCKMVTTATHNQILAHLLAMHGVDVLQPQMIYYNGTMEMELRINLTLRGSAPIKTGSKRATIDNIIVGQPINIDHELFSSSVDEEQNELNRDQQTLALASQRDIDTSCASTNADQHTNTNGCADVSMGHCASQQPDNSINNIHSEYRSNLDQSLTTVTSSGDLMSDLFNNNPWNCPTSNDCSETAPTNRPLMIGHSFKQETIQMDSAPSPLYSVSTSVQNTQVACSPGQVSSALQSDAPLQEFTRTKPPEPVSSAYGNGRPGARSQAQGHGQGHTPNVQGQGHTPLVNGRRTNQRVMDQCKICFKVFRAKNSLNRHMFELHSVQSRIFACPSPGCGKRYKRRDEMKAHFQTKHNNK